MAEDPYAEFGAPISSGTDYSDFGPPINSAPSTPAMPKSRVNVASSPADKAMGWLGTTGADVGLGMWQSAIKAPNVPIMLANKLLGDKAPNTVAQNTAQRVGQGIEQTGEMMLAGGALRSGAGLLASKFPWLGRLTAPAARIAAESVNTGVSAALHDQPVGTAIVVGGAGAGVGEIGSAIAPKLIQKALGISGRDTQFGKTPGAAILENTSGLTPGQIAKQGGRASQKLTAQMEANVGAASGTLTTDTAHQVIDDAIAKAPRNATTYKDKLADLKRTLSLDATGRREFSPDEILEMKRGVDKEIGSWDRDVRKSIDPIKRKLYKALDSQLDAAVPGNADLNQRISSMITGTKAAQATAFGRPQQMLRVLAQRGAIGTIAGGLGYAQGGPQGAIEFGGAALALQSPTARIAIARLMNSGFPENIARAIVAGQPQGGK